MLHKRIQMIISKWRSSCSLIALLTMSWLWSSCTVRRVAGCDGFDELFQPTWAPEHVECEGDQTKLTLDSSSGCGFGSMKTYLFGLTTVQIKLVQGDSAGTVTAFYMSSDAPNHDELDFEFLGNLSGEPYLVQTNVYVNGTGDREQRHSLWFDPTLDFHTYSLFWNRRFIMFLVDGIPVRVFTNKEESRGVPYPKSQPMRVRGSVWNADDWATQGGRVKTNWSHAPFVSSFRSFGIDACELSPETDDIVTKCRQLGQYWWDKPSFDEIGRHRSRQLTWVRKKHLVYDYCQDKLRFSELPKECVD
ncbi:xyloglucan endotransglucosylase/hydrolase protein 9-like [Rhodamnia argentea]|uniref:Xyloglucan endotransglucosylase/hydrolase n=1 Tax=Rhodamnia argentea TaxID=178133 RepID=A0A8B8Q2C3_9MYRT|nr:xyloglucan endotransglucosylase/hydrolase protein 9-like [Rhodamnia argentea]